MKKLALYCWCLGAAMVTAQSAFDELIKRAGDAVDARPEESVALYKQALAINPDYVDGWLYMGAGLYQLQRYAEAGAAFQKGVKLAPGNGTAWGFLGLCRYELGDSTQALEAILKGEALALGGNPMFNAAVRTRGAMILISRNAFDEALVQLKPLAAVGTNPPQSIEVAGSAALRIAKPLAELSVEQREMVTLAGQAVWAAAAQQEAGGAFQALVNKYPNQPGVHYAYGIFLKDGEPKLALAEFERELALDPKNGAAYLQLALLRSGAAALPAARAAVRLEPGNPLAHRALGRAFLAAGQDAVAELEAAQKLAPDDVETRSELAEAYRRAGQLADAAKQTAAVASLKERQEFGMHAFVASKLPVPGAK